jgi:nitrogenase molybdenum-cofactor synthesis protein NifE
LTEQDIIMGRSEKRLFHAIKQAIDNHAPPAVFIFHHKVKTTGFRCETGVE